MSEIRVDNIIGETGVDAVRFTKGVNVTGIVTATSFTGSVAASQLTGALPAISGANLTGISQLVKQVVTGTTVTQAYKSNNSTYGDTGLTATITPASGTKILVVINQPVYTGSHNFTGNSLMYIKVLRDSTELSQSQFGRDTVSGNGWQELWGLYSFTYLDTHGANGSTAVTYKTQYKGSSNTEAYVQRSSEFGATVNRANINLIEVAV